MTYMLLALTLASAASDSVIDIPRLESRYSRKVLINTLLGAACVGGMAIFHMKANDAYDEYQASESMSSALESWDRVERYDNIRNVFAVGAVVFVTRAIYYQIKKAKLIRSAHIVPLIDLRYAGNSKMVFGIKKSL